MAGATASDAVAQVRRVHLYPDAGAMRGDVVARIARLANACIRDHGSFHIVLAGGATPLTIYRALGTIESDWPAWHIYFGDERCLPEGDTQRNDSMAREVWLSHVAIPRQQIHVIPAELGAEAGARTYANVLANVNRLDLVLLGLGEDGHTASLFPGHSHDGRASVVAVHGAPKPPPQRISLGAGMLSKGDHVWFLVNGEGKRKALARWQQGESIPASTIFPRAGVDIFTDIDLGEV